MNLKDGAMIGLFIVKAIRNPEGAVCDLVDDFKKSSKAQNVVQRLSAYIRDKYECSDMDIYIDTDDTLVLVLSDITEENVTQMMSDAVKYADKAGSFVGRNETVFNEKIRSALEQLRVRYDSGNQEAQVMATLPSQKVVDKLKEVVRTNE